MTMATKLVLYVYSAICIQETWLSDQHDQLFFQLEGYNFISQPKTSSNHGGVGIYLSESYDYSELQLYTGSQVWDGMFIEVKAPSISKKLIIGNIYRPPRNNNQNYDIFISELQPIFEYLNTKKCEIVISGDFNIDLLKLKEKPKFNQFYDSLCTFNFIPKITLPTRLGKHTATLIDNFYCNLSIECFTSPTYIITTQISDHLPYIMILNAPKANISPPKYIQINNINTKTMLNFKEKNASANIYEKLDKQISSDPNSNSDIIIKHIMEIKNETMPTRQVKFNKHKHKNSQWITQGIIRSIAHKDKLYITLKKTPTNNPDYDAIKLNLHTYTKLLKSNIRQAKQIYYNNCFLKYKQDIRNTWATIKEIMGKNTLTPSHTKTNPWQKKNKTSRTVLIIFS